MIENISTHAEAGRALQTFLVVHASSLPEFTRDKLIEAAGAPSPVDRQVQAVEALFAAKSALNEPARILTAQLARFTANQGFHDMPERGAGIAAAVLRDGGFKAPKGDAWPKEDEDPAPKSQFVAPIEGEI